MWIYETPFDGVRTVLGPKELKTLYCIGANPSTATPKQLDPTVKRVKGIVEYNIANVAAYNDFDSWVMLNVYPQIATDPIQVDAVCNPAYHTANLDAIAKYVPDGATIWAAWGDLIDNRPYFIECLREINSKVLCRKGITWVAGGFTKQGNPRHPLFLKASTTLGHFDFSAYIKTR
jgi:hypothetical protein